MPERFVERRGAGGTHGIRTMTRLKAALVVTLGLAVLAQAAVSSQKAAGAAAKAMTLTDLDHIEIRQLVARYAFAVDTGGNNGYDYADLFSNDGEFMRPYSRGREQLARLARGGRLGPANVVHYITNHVIEPTPEGAVGKEYLFELTFNPPAPRGAAAPAATAGGAQAGAPAGRGQGGGGRNVNQWEMIGRKNGELARTGGHYEDIYVKTSEGWRFRKRDFIPSKRGANPTPLAPPRIPADAPTDLANAPPPPANFILPTKQTTLTALDYMQIEQLVSSYGHALDSGYGKGENGEAYASLYTPDANFGGAAGHDQLAALARAQPRGPDYVRHYLTNHVIEPTPDGGARGKQYLVVFDISEKGEPGTIISAGTTRTPTSRRPPAGASRRAGSSRRGPDNDDCVEGDRGTCAGLVCGRGAVRRGTGADRHGLRRNPATGRAHVVRAGHGRRQGPCVRGAVHRRRPVHVENGTAGRSEGPRAAGGVRDGRPRAPGTRLRARLRHQPHHPAGA